MKKAVFVAMASTIAAALSKPATAGEQQAIFAGGCFWCMESDFEHVPGVISVESGYTGGTLENPTYRNHEGHVEAVRVIFDDAKVSYAELLEKFDKPQNLSLLFSGEGTQPFQNRFFNARCLLRPSANRGMWALRSSYRARRTTHNTRARIQRPQQAMRSFMQA